jgi:energy-coupling factor transporter ATP-binding protein EcfA2
MEIKVTDIWCILGKRGSGKSELTKHFLRIMQKNEYPILILDLNDEYSKDEFETGIIFKPKTIKDYIEGYERVINNFIQSNNSGMIVFEDIDVLVSSTSIPFPILDLVIRGRHKNIGCMFLFRRGNNIHKQILYNSHHIFIPRITLPNDIKYLSDYIPMTNEIVPHLKKYEFFHYDFEIEENKQEEEHNIVKLDLKTDILKGE